MSETSTGAPDAILEARRIGRRFGGVVAVDDVSFTVSRGEIAGLMGPNGAGKSTVLDLIAGTLRPDRGSIFFENREITGRPPYRLARLGVIRTFQSTRGFPNLTVLENLLAGAPSPRGDSLKGAMLGKRWWSGRQDELVRDARLLLERFGMAAMEDAYAKALSGGQRRLLDIMRALMAKPSLLLLDEPMAGVSLGLADRIAGYLLALREDGITILMIEHVFELLDTVCDRVFVMAQGRVVASGDLSEVRASSVVQEAYAID